MPQHLTKYVNEDLLPQLCVSSRLSQQSISESSAKQWLWKLGYCCVESQKGMYIDGYECDNVIKYQKEYLKFFQQMMVLEGVYIACLIIIEWLNLSWYNLPSCFLSRLFPLLSVPCPISITFRLHPTSSACLLPPLLQL